jgi:choice-of-anchor A domain-containing protein
VAVSRRGSLTTTRLTNITGDVDEFAARQVSGRGTIGGSIVTNATVLNTADADAATASSAARALTANQTFGNIRTATTVTGNGGLNVIQIGGNINASLTLSGSAADIFIVNVRGSLRLGSQEGLLLSGGVTADHVIYNFTGTTGSVTLNAGSTANGTILAPRYNVSVNGATVNGELIAGGGTLHLGQGATVNQVSFNPAPPVTANGTLSGVVFVDYNANGLIDPGDNPFSNVLVTLTGTDDLGPVSLGPVQPDANGVFSFTGLRAGTYTLSFSLINPSDTGVAIVGTVGGVTDGMVIGGVTINGIVLTGTSVGTNYNFGVAPPLT